MFAYRRAPQPGVGNIPPYPRGALNLKCCSATFQIDEDKNKHKIDTYTIALQEFLDDKKRKPRKVISVSVDKAMEKEKDKNLSSLSLSLQAKPRRI